MTDDNCTESWNNKSETTDCKMKRAEFSQSYFPLQFLKFTKVKPLSKKRMFYSWLQGPLIQNAYHLGPTLSAPPPHSKLHSSLSWRVSLIWEAELWKAKQKDSTLVGRKSFLSFPKEWPIFLLSCCPSVSSQEAAVLGWGALGSGRALSPRLSTVLQRELSVPGTAAPAPHHPAARLCSTGSCWEDVLSHGMTHWLFSPCSLVSSE